MHICFYLVAINTYLLYLIGHNNLINGFRPAATHPSRRLCFLRAYDSWLYLVSPKDTRSSSSSTSADPRIKYPSRRSILLHTNDIAEPAQPLNINTLHNVCRWGAHIAHYWIDSENHSQLALDRRSYVRLFSRILLEFKNNHRKLSNKL